MPVRVLKSALGLEEGVRADLLFLFLLDLETSCQHSHDPFVLHVLCSHRSEDVIQYIRKESVSSYMKSLQCQTSSLLKKINRVSIHFILEHESFRDRQ